MNKLRSLVTNVPELTVLILIVIAGYIVGGVFSQVGGTEALSSSYIWLIIVGSFIVSTAIAMLAVIAGIGGGVIFTPIMMGFTSIDTLIIRATGLVVAMFSGLISSGPFMKKGLADIKVVFYCAVPIVVGAMIGSISAVYLRAIMGATGDALVRLLLGFIMLVVSYFFITGGGRVEYPEVRYGDRFSKKLGLNSAYWEESLQKTVYYQLTRALPGGILFILLGFIGGFFGLGGGAFLTATLNLIMGAPLKVSAACSGVLLAISNATAIWTYVIYGALMVAFAAPWMLGQVVGGIIGAHLLIRIRAAFVRKILIVILIVSAIKLVARGIEGFTGISIPIL